MPLYNHLLEWNGLDIEVQPAEPWRKKIRFWPYFVGQRIQLELRVKMLTANEKSDLHFHLGEQMADVDKPRMIAPTLLPDQSTSREKIFSIQNGTRITGKGEVKYWVSNRGYNVDNEPIFTAETINLDSLIIPIILMVLGPLLVFLSGLILGLLLGS
jgi:hypothetical protein